MPNIVIAGAQWGDEGKGKIVDLLTAQRPGRGPLQRRPQRRPHRHRGRRSSFVLHLIPSGILHPGILCVMGNGMVIDPWALEKEIAELRASAASRSSDNLVISDRAHLILPHHRALEALAEERARRAQDRHHAARHRPRVRGQGRPPRPAHGRPAAAGDAARRSSRRRAGTTSRCCRGAGRAPDVDWDALLADLIGVRRAPPRRASRTSSLVLHQQMAQRLLGPVRGRAGDAARPRPRHLSVRHLARPRPRAAPRPASACRPTRDRRRPRHRQGLHARAWATGPLPDRDRRRRSRTRSASAATSTAPPRAARAAAAGSTRSSARYSVRVNGFDTLALTKLDVLDELDEIKVCTGYRFEGETLDETSRRDSSVLEACEPVYETLPGWKHADRGRARLARAARGRARATSSGSASWSGSRSASSPPAPTATTRSCAPRARSRAGSREPGRSPRVLTSRR